MTSLTLSRLPSWFAHHNQSNMSEKQIGNLLDIFKIKYICSVTLGLVANAEIVPDV